MTRQQRYQRVLDYYREAMPKVTTELQFGSAFQLLVATLLSAQCTDKRINQVTPALFSRYPTAQAMAQAEAEVDDVLQPCRASWSATSMARYPPTAPSS